MVIYADLFFVINFLIDFLLLMGTNRLCLGTNSPWRCILAASLGALYAVFCILPGFYFLGNTLWRVISMVLLAVIAFGVSRETPKKAGIFFFLSTALGGIGTGLLQGNGKHLLLSVLLLGSIAYLAFRYGKGSPQYVPVELTYRGAVFRLTAMIDTGNTLKDPITGEQVLVVMGDIGKEILGEDTSDPVALVAGGRVPGLRLIPYRCVGSSNALMAAIKPESIRINGRERAGILGFAPGDSQGNGTYQALAGGISV